MLMGRVSFRIKQKLVHSKTTYLFRFIGGKKEVAEFEQYRQVGPIVKVVPFSMGKGVVIAVLNDPNYEVIQLT
jgi:hypothetical protein